jgi:hypothetical protein
MPAQPPANRAPIGAACTKPSDCSDDLCIGPASVPGGYCSKACGGQLVSQANDCPAGSQCFQVSEASSVCLDLCTGGNDCRQDYVCAPVGTSRICAPACKSDEDCEVGEVCNLTTGLCQEGVRRTPAAPGEPCTTNTDCTTGLCLTEAAFPGGYCLGLCTQAEVGKACGGTTKGVCVALVRPDRTAYACMGACSTGVDCRPEYMCSASIDVPTPAAAGMCLPRCENYSCGAGETCDSSVGICTEGGPTSGAAQVDQRSLGTFVLGPSDASSRTVSVQVPPDAVSYSLVLNASTQTKFVLTKVVAPGGAVVLDISDFRGSAFKWQDVFESGVSGLLFPNAPRLTLIPGTYQLTFAASVEAEVSFASLVKRQTGVIQNGSLPIVIWFTRNQFLNARTAQTDPRFQEALNGFVQIYAGAGITLGPVTYLDITGAAATQYAVIDEFSELDGLFAQADMSDAQAVHLFMIEQATGELDGLLGIAGGIPGPPAYPGLVHSGVAVALAFLSENVDIFAETMAHEAGHFLGLYHLSERSGFSHDPLLDTPECSTQDDRNNDGIISATECQGKGTDNLMFWSASNVRQRVVTNDQRFVLTRNPSVR